MKNSMTTMPSRSRRIIRLSKHHERWSTDFVKEAEKLQCIHSENLIAAYHIGSTAIPGIHAKPVIDILIEVYSLIAVDQSVIRFIELGYEPKGENGIEGRRFFHKGGDERTHHLHIFKQGHPEIERHKLFVEFMNAHPDKASAYEKRKVELARKFKREPMKYSKGKSVFISAIDQEAMKWKKTNRTDF